MKKQILFLDDDIHLRESISCYLRSEGFIIEAVGTVQLAISSINVNKPDLIIADIMMPHLDGYDFIKILRIHDSLSYIPIIFLTAKGMTSDRIKGYELGCNAYLTKPFNPHELVAIINNVLKGIEIWTVANVIKNEQISRSTKEYLLGNKKLTPREVTIFNLVSQGLMNKEIAIKLHLSIRNVEKYVSRLLKKTNTRNRTELAQLAWNDNSEGE